MARGGAKFWLAPVKLAALAKSIVVRCGKFFRSVLREICGPFFAHLRVKSVTPSGLPTFVEMPHDRSWLMKHCHVIMWPEGQITVFPDGVVAKCRM